MYWDERIEERQVLQSTPDLEMLTTYPDKISLFKVKE